MPAPKGHPAYNVNGEGGRPAIYDDSTLDNLAFELDEWIKDESEIWLKDFFLQRFIEPNYCDQFCNRHERFRLSHSRAKQIQEARLFKGALKNKFSTKMAEFGLMHNHGWATKTESKISGDPTSPLLCILNQTKELIDDKTESNESGRTSCY